MTREEAIMWLIKPTITSTEISATKAKELEAYNMAIEALTDRPTESDFISKAKVLETYSELYWFDIDCGVVSKAEVDKIYERLQSLPSADRPTWECKDCTYWDKLDYEAPRQGWCNQFEEWTDADEFCSRCAKMKGGTE